MADDAAVRWVDDMPAAYERELVPAVFRPFALELAGRVGELAPHAVLEVAAGTGVLTRELVRVADDVVATDLNAAMVELGRRAVPQATWRQADALDLPFDAAAFDVVACSFGVMFFPDKVAGLAQAHRVLRPGGTLLLTSWGDVREHAFGVAVVDALGDVLPDDPPRFLAAVPHGYRDRDVVAGDVRAAGFRDVDVADVVLEGRATSARGIAVGFCTGTPLRAELTARGDLDELVRRVADAVEARLGPGPVTGRMRALVVRARRDDR